MELRKGGREAERDGARRSREGRRAAEFTPPVAKGHPLAAHRRKTALAISTSFCKVEILPGIQRIHRGPIAKSTSAENECRTLTVEEIGWHCRSAGIPVNYLFMLYLY